MKIDLNGKSAVVTGGNIGIGRAFSLALARAGAEVVATYFTDGFEPFAEGAQTIHGMKLDATRSEDVNVCMREAAELLGGKIDILVNNAGGLMGRVPVLEMSDEHFHSVIDVNLTSAFYCVRAVLGHMPDGGRILNLASLAAHDGGGQGSVIYSAAKAGIIGLTRGLAKELGSRKISVNALAPGFVANTTFHNTFTPRQVQDAIVGKTPLGRAGTPDDIANVAVFLASEQGGFINGEVVEINGGLYFV